ncbi:MAG: hypothetical protein ACRDRR_19275 [Pseudonocardiaceae bacterium]
MWRAQIVVTAALDPFRWYATALADQLPDAVRMLDAFHVPQARVDRPGRRPPPRPAHPDRPPRPQTRPAVSGDPDGEVTAARVIAQDLMVLYQATDPETGRAQADTVITRALSCPSPKSPTWAASCPPGAPSYSPTSTPAGCRMDPPKRSTC